MSDLLIALRRRYFRAREMFHDWMWQGGPKPSLPRRLARALPLHFSDPYYMTREQFDTAWAKGSPVIAAGSPWVRVYPGATSTSGTTSMWVWTTNTTWDRRTDS